jgi:hypothetical protein
MNVMRIVAIFLMINLISCTSVEKSEMKAAPLLEAETTQKIYQLVINEYSPKGMFVNENGEETDWIELYNNSDSVLKIGANEWFLSDDENETNKFALPEMSIAPHGFVLVLCDGEASSEKYIHANFKISSDNETISLYHQSELADEIICTEDLKKKFSFGRESDGQISWSKIKVPSPGESNNSSENYAETAH